jgi:lysophospholipase L1-like esterase
VSITRSGKENFTASQFGSSWDLILLSGGGNDLIDDADDILLPPRARPAAPSGPVDYCDPARLAQLTDEVQTGYRSIVALRDAPGSTAPGKPIVAHTYDYPTARNSPARFVLVPVLGPWLYRALTHSEVPQAEWVSVTDYLVDQLAEAILALAAGPNALPNFYVVDTRGTLKRARPGSLGEDGDWMNEIHPSIDGYKKLAKKLAARVTPLLRSQ